MLAIAMLGTSLGAQRAVPTGLPASAIDSLLAFPGAQGWAARTPGGRGGRILRVTTLDGAGPGSLREAVAASGPRIIVFEVGGTIDLDKQQLQIREPYLTIAGQTAPSPGITLIRGGIDVRTHDVVVRHIRVRVGEAGAAKKSGWEADGLSTGAGAHDVIVDHCSISWATDENLSTSGPRFTGSTPDEWRRNTSHRITFSNNIVAEGLSRSTHSKGNHSKGTLVHDNVTDVLIVGNLYAHNVERNPLFKGGARGAIVNNLIYDPGPRAVHYNLLPAEWGTNPYQTGQITAVGNVLRAGPSTPSPIAFLQIGGDGDLEFYGRDNIAVDRVGAPLPMTGRYTTSPARIVPLASPPRWPPGVQAIAASGVQRAVLRDAGARPWDRDADDTRIIANVAEGLGQVLDSEQQVNGYPRQRATGRPFVESEWDLRTMLPRSPATLSVSGSDLVR
jgi:hypothetical protein